jgi:hypothetical protein
VKTYLKDQLERFLESVDAALGEQVAVVVIGGTAAALRYGVKHPTRGIATMTAISAGLANAVQAAREATGLEVPMRMSGITEGPEGLESRLERALPHLERLIVWVPEKHDLVLMKTLRAEQHDLDAIAEIHAYSPLNLDILVQRFKEELDPVGNPLWIRANFLAVVERLFPQSVEAVVRRLRAASS